MSRPRLFETIKIKVVETETGRDWSKVVETKTFSRVSLFSGLVGGNLSKVNVLVRNCTFKMCPSNKTNIIYKLKPPSSCWPLRRRAYTERLAKRSQLFIEKILPGMAVMKPNCVKIVSKNPIPDYSTPGKGLPWLVWFGLVWYGMVWLFHYYSGAGQVGVWLDNLELIPTKFNWNFNCQLEISLEKMLRLS